MTSSRRVLLPVRKGANFMGSKKNGRPLTVTGREGAIMAALAPRPRPLQLCLGASQGSHWPLKGLKLSNTCENGSMGRGGGGAVLVKFGT